jgi:hypothetical protein
VHARDQVDFTDARSTVLQTWGNAAELRVDRLSGDSDYGGILLQAEFNGPHGPVELRRTNVVGQPSARQLFWVANQSGAGPVALDEVWVDVPPERGGGLSQAVRPTNDLVIGSDSEGRPTASWPEATEPAIVGMVTEGSPPGGDFVPTGVAGIGYESPGYRP